MKLYRAKISFIDSDWIDNGKEIMMRNYIISEGTIIALDREPKAEYWEEFIISAEHHGGGFNGIKFEIRELKDGEG